MSRIASATHLVKNLPAISERHNIIKQLITANIGIYAYYKLSSGPTKLRLSRDFTLQPESGPQALFTYHFVHTHFWPLVFNCSVLATVGSQLVAARGASNFLRLLGIGAAGSALFAGFDVRHNENQVQAGSLGISAALLTYTAFYGPGHLSLIRFSPMTIVGATLLYGLYSNDKAVLGGATAGYLAFVLAL